MPTPARSTRPASAAPRSATPSTPAAPGAPATKIDEALATFLAANFLALAKSASGECSFEIGFSRALSQIGEAKTVTDGKQHYAANAAQRVIATAQAAGLVEGDVLTRLGVKS